MTTRLFVYGTLMRGGAAHRLIENALPLGVDVTEPHYDLVDLGGYPGLVHGEQRIVGECYEVSGAVLHNLDRYEGVPMLYKRLPIVLERRVGFYAYFYARKNHLEMPVVRTTNEDGDLLWRT